MSDEGMKKHSKAATDIRGEESIIKKKAPQQDWKRRYKEDGPSLLSVKELLPRGRASEDK